MISLDPANRSTCEEYLASYRKTAFPDIFYDFLHPFISSLNSSSPTSTAPPATPPLAIRVPGISTPAETAKSVQPNRASLAMRNDADERIETIWNEWESIAGFLDGGLVRKGEDRSPEAAETSKAGVSVFFVVTGVLLTRRAP